MSVFAADSTYFTMIWLVIMIAIFYFLLIRPQKKKEKEQPVQE